MDRDSIAVVLAILVQTAGFFFAGGKLWQLVKTHDREITSLRGSRHEHAQSLQKLTTLMEIVMQDREEGRA